MPLFRRKYGLLLATIMVLFFLLGSPVLLVLLGILTAMPLLLWLALCYDTRRLQLVLHKPVSCVTGQDAVLQLELQYCGWLLATSLLQVTVVYENQMIGQTVAQPFRLSLNSGQRRFVLPLDTSCCGAVGIGLQQAVCIDYLGIAQRACSLPQMQFVTIYPQSVSLKLDRGLAPFGYIEGIWSSHRQQKSAVGEVFDLRQYRPGDDIRTIHWKLSSKSDELIVRETGADTRYQTLLLFDAGLQLDGKLVDPKLLSGAIALCAAVSDQLCMLGLHHTMNVVFHQSRKQWEIAQKEDCFHMMRAWMSMRLPEHCGMGLQNLLTERQREHYTKLIYVTVGKTPLDLEQLSDQCDVTVLLVTQNQLLTVVEDGCKVVSLPLTQLYDGAYTIAI